MNKLILFLLLTIPVWAGQRPYRFVVVNQSNLASSGQVTYRIDDAAGAEMRVQVTHTFQTLTTPADAVLWMEARARESEAQDLALSNGLEVWPVPIPTVNVACNGTDKVSSFNSSGTPVCTVDVGGGATNLRVASADYTNSTTGFTNVTGLTLAVGSGTFNVECDLLVSAAATTTGIQIALNGPANSSLRYHSEYFTSATAKATWGATTYDASSAANGTYPVASGGTTITTYKLLGQIVATGSGTIAVRARSEIAASAITIYRGSSCTVF